MFWCMATVLGLCAVHIGLGYTNSRPRLPYIDLRLIDTGPLLVEIRIVSEPFN